MNWDDVPERDRERVIGTLIQHASRYEREEMFLRHYDKAPHRMTRIDDATRLAKAYRAGARRLQP